jgi:uroporphyrinogen-III synthase
MRERRAGAPIGSQIDMTRDAILITRPEPAARETAALIEALGLRPVVAPLLEVRLLAARLTAPERLAAILLTSGNAVASIPPAYRALPVLTVGAATASLARAAGMTSVSSADGDATALAALTRRLVRPDAGAVLLATGQGQGLALATELREAGYRVVRRVVYRARPVAELPAAAVAALRDERLRAVLFFSAETARCFARLVRRGGLAEALRGRDAITIGPSAAMALKGLAWAAIRVARAPNQDEMLALLR